MSEIIRYFLMYTHNVVERVQKTIKSAIFAVLALKNSMTRDCLTIVFIARRYAKCGKCHRRISVCVCFSVSVTLRYCIKMAKRRITQIMPHDSPVTLVF